MQIQECQKSLVIFNSTMSDPRHLIIKLPQIKDKDLQDCKRKETNNIQGCPNSSDSRLFSSKNLTGHERVACDFHSTDREKKKNKQPCQLRILCPAQLSFRNERDKDFPRQTKTERICLHQIYYIINAKGSSLS